VTVALPPLPGASIVRLPLIGWHSMKPLVDDRWAISATVRQPDGRPASLDVAGHVSVPFVVGPVNPDTGRRPALVMPSVIIEIAVTLDDYRTRS
jgi:hypothetical protein